jgi:GH25 family lysozyme M1 (1,4-beta-N-acetylmuramidase)
VTIYGVDVASYQGNPDWAQVHASGISFGFSKVTQGTGYVNPTWGHNRAGMLAQPAAGFLPGAYHFLEEGNAVAQVAHFLANAGDLSGMAVGLDIEPATSRPSVATAHAWVTEFHRRTGNHPVLSYFPAWYWQQLGDPNISFADPIWQSEYVSGSGSPAGLYGRVPSSWWSGFGGAQVALLQFSSSATVPGISGQVDVSAFKGTLGELRALALGGHVTPTPTPTPVPPTVQEDDMYGQLNRGAGEVTPISWDTGRYKAVGFFADTDLAGPGADGKPQTVKLHVRYHVWDKTVPGGKHVDKDITVSSPTGKTVVSFGTDAAHVDAVSVRRDDDGAIPVSYDAS